MQTLHLRADKQVIDQIMFSINELAKQGNEIEILDNFAFQKEKELVLTALDQIKNGELYSHKEVWEELLN